MWRNRISRKLMYLGSNENKHLIAKFSRWLKRNQDCVRKHDNIVRTEMFVQEEFNIYELPIVIKKTNDIQSIIDTESIDKLNTDVCIKQCNQKINIVANNIPDFKNLNLDEILNQIRIISPEKKINSLERAVYTEINSRIALQCLNKIVDMERKHYKLIRASKLLINRHMIIKLLTEIIASSKNSENILEALSVILKDKFISSNNFYKDILTDEALIRCTNGDFSIQQLIEISRVLSIFRDSKYQDTIDYFWTGFVIKQQDITADHLVPLFKLLIYMKRSKNRVQALLEKKLAMNYHKLSALQMTNILNMFNNNLKSTVVPKCVSKWAIMHLPAASKYDFLEFVESLTAAKYINSTLEKAIEKTLNTKYIKSSDHALIAAVAVYCTTVYLRNMCICEKVVKYIEKHGRHIPLDSLIELIIALGNLNFKPESKQDFWYTFGQILDQQFFYLRQDKVMHILLSCAYINKYFPKCMEKICTPEFLDQVELHDDSKSAQLLRSQLYLLDTAMSLECPAYSGPLLFHSNELDPIVIDARITQMINKIYSQLIKLAGDSKKLDVHVTLNKLSTTPLYTIDALIYKRIKSNTVLELNLEKKNENTAVLVLLPHYYCWNSYKLIGEQAMKVRHLRKLGFRIMLIDFNYLSSINDNVDELAKYLNHAFKTAHQAL